MIKDNFSNLNQLNRYMDQLVKKSLEYCAWRTENVLKQLLEERLYDFYDPKMYDRTYELLKSISHSDVIKSSNGSYFVEIYYDIDKIRSYPRIQNKMLTHKWGQHTDFYDDDVSMWIPKWIEFGTDNKYFSHKGTNSMEDTKKWISKEYNRLFTLILKEIIKNDIK